MIALYGIIRRELKVTFTTPVAYVVFFFFTFLSSALFYSHLLEYEKRLQKARHFEDPELAGMINFNDVLLGPMFLSIEIVLIIVVSLLTMRMFAEERRQKTMELLMTSPINSWQVVVGKFIAYLGVILCICAVVLVYPAILSTYGTNTLVGMSVIDWPTSLLGIFGVFLAGAAFGAVGFFFSSVTDSQIVAALFSFFSALLSCLMILIGQKFEGAIGNLMTFMSPVSHIGNFARGIFDLTDFCYFLSVTLLFLALTTRMVEGQRWR